MNIIQIVPYIGDESSGTAYCVPRLCQSLANQGVHVELHTLAPLPKLKRINFELFGYPRARFPHPRLGRSPEMKQALLEAASHADIIHSNGLWMAPNIYPYWAARKNGKKLVVMPHGTITPWSLNNSVFKKKLCWWMGQRNALLQADMLVATAENEYHYLRDMNLKQPIVILPNGIDIPEKISLKGSRRTMLFLSRIHPKKGLHILIPVWRLLQEEFPEWDLKIAGPITPYAIEMQKLANDLGCDRIDFCGEVHGEEKLRLMSQSECLILPTFSENFGMVVAEALAAGTAAICTRNAPWEGLNIHKCGISCDCNKSDIEAAMREMMTHSRQENCEMGQRGRKWVEETLSWDDVGKKLFVAYQWLLNETDKPSWVIKE